MNSEKSHTHKAMKAESVRRLKMMNGVGNNIKENKYNSNTRLHNQNYKRGTVFCEGIEKYQLTQHHQL